MEIPHSELIANVRKWRRDHGLDRVHKRKRREPSTVVPIVHLQAMLNTQTKKKFDAGFNLIGNIEVKHV